MAYHSLKNSIIDTDANKKVAIATYEGGAVVIANALNYYFSNTFTRNQTIELIHKNTSDALERIANFLEKHEYSADMAIEYLREISEELKAQALVVSLREELKFNAPK